MFSRTAVFGLFFLSGIAGLIYQGGVAQAVSRRKFAPVADADADRRLRPFVAPELEQQVPVAAIDRDGRRLEAI